MGFNPLLALLVGILIGWLLGWLLEILFLRYDRLDVNRKLAQSEADLRQRDEELAAARITIAGLQSKAAPEAESAAAAVQAPVEKPAEAPVAIEAESPAPTPAGDAGVVIAAEQVEAGEVEQEVTGGVPVAATEEVISGGAAIGSEAEPASESAEAPVRELQHAPAVAIAAHASRDGQETTDAEAAAKEQAAVEAGVTPEAFAAGDEVMHSEAVMPEQVGGAPAAELEVPELQPELAPRYEAEVRTAGTGFAEPQQEALMAEAPTPATVGEAGLGTAGAAALVASDQREEVLAENSVPEMAGMAPDETAPVEAAGSPERSYTWQAVETTEGQVEEPESFAIQAASAQAGGNQVDVNAPAETPGRLPSVEFEEPTYEMSAPPEVVLAPEEAPGLPAGVMAAEAPAGIATAAAVGIAALSADRQAGPEAIDEGGPAGEDDLTRLEGIGPVYAAKLRQNGIDTFAAVADTDEARLAEIIEAPAWRRVNYGEWVAQARLAADRDDAGLKALQDKLFSRDRDNLMLIKGVGAKTAGALHAAGIVTFVALGEATAGRLAEINREAGLRGGDYEGWIAEAKLRSAGKRVPRVRKAHGKTKEMACPQDLEKVRGVGQGHEQKLYGAGIGTYWELAQADDDELARILEIKDFQKVNLGAIKAEALRLAEETGTTESSWGGTLPDDFEALEGIGEIYEGRLYEAGVCTYKSLANATVEELAAICMAPAWRMPDYAGWIAQAQALVAKE